MPVTRPPASEPRIPGTAAVMSSDPRSPDEQPPDRPQDGPQDTAPDTAPDADPDEVEPAFDIDLEPEDQGTAGAGEEPTG